MDDLVAYLTHAAPADIPWSQVRNLTRIRRAWGRPISMRGYAALRLMLGVEEWQARYRKLG
jgi:hypothetical protein